MKLDIFKIDYLISLSLKLIWQWCLKQYGNLSCYLLLKSQSQNFVVKMYSNNEYVDMILILGESGNNFAHAVRLYAERFPARRHPDANVIKRTVQRLRETGQLSIEKNPDLGRPRRVRRPSVEEEVLDLVEADGSRSTRSIAQEVGISYASVHRILGDEGYYPYHSTKVQELLPEDYVLRRNFCNWLLEQNRNNPEFISNILWTDEANFSKDGYFNSRNTHFYALENPHLAIQKKSQHRFSVNVWAGIIGQHLLGPIILPHRLNGENFLHFLQHNLMMLINPPLEWVDNMWIQMDGVPAHFAAPARNFLNNEFGDRWIGRNGPIRWPPRSPDLTPLDFFLWGHIKFIVYQTPVLNEEEHINRITLAAATVNGNMRQRVKLNLIRRSEACLQANGQHFEQFL